MESKKASVENLKNINQILLFILIIFVLLYFGSSFLIPFVFGLFFASLMAPFSNILEKYKINRILSSLISTLVIFIVAGGILSILIWQLSMFIFEIAEIRNEIQSFIRDIQNHITSFFGLSLEEQNEFWEKRSGDILTAFEAGITKFLGNLLNILGGFLLVLVYAYLLIYYRSKFIQSVLMFFSGENKKVTGDILHNITGVVYHYLLGRVQVMALLGILYYITLLIFGIPYAILLTIFGALITIIPYLGPLISGLLPILFGIIYLQDLPIIILFTVIIITIQLVESYVFEPMVIGHEVKINPLTVIIAITLGAMVWGIAGMIMFVPMFAVIKIICSHIPGLKPIGYFFGTA
jgi:predicted PurR-regulated permease PerM